MTSASPPTHLLLGSDAVDLVRSTLEQTQRRLEAWADLSRSTDALATPA